MTDVTWDAATIERLREMRAEGLASGPIAKALGCTRNAVIGKCRRLDIPSVRQRNNNSGIPQSDQVRLARPPAPIGNGTTVGAQPVARTPSPPPAPIVFAEPSAPVPTAALLPHHCRYPLWGAEGAPDFLACGRAKLDDSPYCESHDKICFQKAKAA